SIQETKSDAISDMKIKFLWGNSVFESSASEAIGNSGGILNVWDPNVFTKSNHVISDNFVSIYETWIPKNMDLLIIFVYAPQPLVEKQNLWSYISFLLSRWNGRYMVLGDFNEVRFKRERMGSVFHQQGANVFNSFILNSSLVEVQLEGYEFTWMHPSGSKMSKLDRFLVSERLISTFPHMFAICLDRHLSDHRPLRDVIADYGAIPFRLYHSWLDWDGFGNLVTNIWNSTNLTDRNGMVRFIRKLQILKKGIRAWVFSMKHNQLGHINVIKSKLRDIDRILDQGGITDDLLLARMDLMKFFQDYTSSDARDQIQKAKIKWAIEGDENSKFFHGIINRKRANLSIKGVMVDGEWVDEPSRVKEEFRTYFSSRFKDPEKSVSRDEIRDAVWDCGINKSPGPDGFSFEFFRKFWNIIGPDMCIAVHDPKFVGDYRPISLIGSLYKVVTKILARRLSFVISELISDVQMAFLPNRQIRDGPFIIDELLYWCKRKKHQAMVFKADFAKAYDSIRWDYLDDVLDGFGFGSKWRSWIKGSLSSGMASILVNGSPTSEFQFHCGLKQGDPLALYLFILVMESLHLLFTRATDEGFFKVIKKSHLLGVGVSNDLISHAVGLLGCGVLKPPFKYLGIIVGGSMSKVNA
nr:RNA-directed DNA polymerase, eukaryota [Tanacetum cinerariifolium]